MVRALHPLESPPSRCVLIVEDNPDGRETLKLLLTLYGCPVEVAADGVEGVQKGLALRPLAAVVDIGLPGLDGYEVAGQLRRALGNNILLIAHTAYDRPEDRERARRAGFDVLVGKPADPEELVKLLRIGTSLPLRGPAVRC
jgi:CheY-like chemotaxis protein